MSLSLTKNLLTTKILFVVILAVPQVKAAKYSYELNYDARYGVHTVGKPDTATNRHTMEYQQKAEYDSQWSSILGLRAEVEAAYASNPDRYGGSDVAKYESQTFLPLENYFQFKTGSLRARLGFQQVVWGEAFGLYYADIVNPKDYRSGGLGDLSRNRINSPMLNLQWIFSDSSLQLLYIPKPFVSILPRPGSDFSNFQLPDGAPAIPMTIERDPVKAPSQGEYGFRFGKQINGFDLSIFYLNYTDRIPIYNVTTILAPLSLVATPEYKPLQSAGTTLTVDFNGYLVRSEIIQHINRVINTFDGTNVSTEKSNELVYVIGLDTPPVDKWIVGFQYSESRLKNANWLTRKNTQSTAAARVSKEFRNNVTTEILATYFTSDSSQLLQANLGFPISNQSEFLFGVDRFDGSSTSEMGRYKDASRVWAMFKTTLKK